MSTQPSDSEANQELIGKYNDLAVIQLAINHSEGSRVAIEYVLKGTSDELKTNTQFAYLSGPPVSKANAGKIAGIEAALNGMSDLIEGRPDGVDYNFVAGENACQNLMGHVDFQKPTVLVAYNDEMALGALRYLNSTVDKIDIPGTVRVVGHDDITFAKYSNPSLSTLKIRRLELATYAIESILRQIDQPGKPITPKEVTPELIVRGTLLRQSATANGDEKPTVKMVTSGESEPSVAAHI